MPDMKRRRNKNQASTSPPTSPGQPKPMGDQAGNGAPDPHDSARHSAKAALRQEGESDEAFRSCTRKKRYASRVEASKAAATNARRKDAPQLFVYECELCGGWHLTHRKPGR